MILRKSQLHLDSLQRRLKFLESKLIGNDKDKISTYHDNTIDLLVQAQTDAENFQRLWETAHLTAQDVNRIYSTSLARNTEIINEKTTLITNLQFEISDQNIRVGNFQENIRQLSDVLSARDT